jgi:hypothetical protein
LVRTRFLGILVLVGVFSAGCGAAMQQSAPVSSRTAVSTAFSKRNATQAAGAPVLGSGKTGVSVRPMPGGTFGLLLVFKNETHRQLELEDVNAVVPHGSFVRQLGTHLAPYFQCKPYCPRHMVMKGPFGVQRPAAIHVRPLNSAQAQLDFAVAGCGALHSGSGTPITQAVLTYRDPSGKTFRQTVALGAAQLELRSTGRIACRT